MHPTLDHSPEFQRQMLEHGDKDRKNEKWKERFFYLLGAFIALLVITVTLACIKTP